MPEVSVIIPVFNPGRRYARKCVQSLRAQTFTDFEAIFVNDGSTDGSFDEISRAARGDQRFRLTGWEQNRGSIPARCHGVEQARGEYIIHLDSDDWLHPGALGVLMEKARKTGADVVIMNFYMHLCRSGVNLTSTPPSLRGLEFTTDNAGPQMVKALFGSKGITPMVWDKLVRRSCYPVEMPALPRVFLGDDTLLSLTFAPNVRSVATTDFCGYYYRMNGASGNWVVSRWNEYKRLHSILCDMAWDFAGPAFPANDLIKERTDMTIYNLLMHTASRSLLTPMPGRTARRILRHELSAPFWQQTREFIESASPAIFDNPKAAEWILRGNAVGLAALVQELIACRWKIILLNKFARYV